MGSDLQLREQASSHLDELLFDVSELAVTQGPEGPGITRFIPESY